MAGETDLEKLIANMEPVLNEGDYVFATVANLDEIPRSVTICEIKEIEGVTIVFSKYDAGRLNISYDYVAAWITLNIHSSLDAVGLTAAFSTALGSNDISCNVVAGYCHDHIFVSKQDKIKAIKVLWNMTKCT
jgi:hypothetical protein